MILNFGPVLSNRFNWIQFIHHKNLCSLVVDCILILLLWSGYLLSQATADTEASKDAEILLGERLFLETRFAQYFYASLSNGGDVNQLLEKGDPVLHKTVRFFGLPPYQIPFADGPYKGKSINCRSCHLIDEHREQPELGMRSYADFASRSPLPVRNDGHNLTVRNSPVLVDVAVQREPSVFHYDGEFSTLLQVIKSTLTGRNLGWLPAEESLAIEHLCRIIREDNGRGQLARQFGGLPYSTVFLGGSSKQDGLNRHFLVAAASGIDVHARTCEEIHQRTAEWIAKYISDLGFGKLAEARSPYDLFLQLNRLPSQPLDGESAVEYSLRLLGRIDELQKSSKLQFVTRNPHTEHGGFVFHDPPFAFGQRELQGLMIFMQQTQVSDHGTGNCVACHPAPHFTDFRLHNIGISQVEYEAIHGPGSFRRLPIPDRIQREQQANLYLPATKLHPYRQGVFRRAAAERYPAYTDLGAWNIFQNDDYPFVQVALRDKLCVPKTVCPTDEHALYLSIAAFKTPGLRNLGHSAPYMHNGQIGDLHALIGYYIAASDSKRRGHLRNGDEELEKIHLQASDIQPLVQFLITLYEDYQ